MRTPNVAAISGAGFCLLFAFAAAGDPVAVLEGTTAEQRASLQTEYLTRHLELSGELLEKVKALNLETAESVQPVIDGNDGMFTKLKVLEAADARKDVAMEALLPADLYRRYQASKSDLRAYMEAGLKRQQAE